MPVNVYSTLKAFFVPCLSSEQVMLVVSAALSVPLPLWEFTSRHDATVAPISTIWKMKGDFFLIISSTAGPESASETQCFFVGFYRPTN